MLLYNTNHYLVEKNLLKENKLHIYIQIGHVLRDVKPTTVHAHIHTYLHSYIHVHMHITAVCPNTHVDY